MRLAGGLDLDWLVQPVQSIHSCTILAKIYNSNPKTYNSKAVTYNCKDKIYNGKLRPTVVS